MWEAVTKRCCGLDVHQKTVVACLLIGLPDQQPAESICNLFYYDKGTRRAAIAVAHKQLTIVRHEPSDGVPYRKLGEDFLDHLNKKSLQKRLARRLEGLGFHVDLILASAGQAS